MAISKQQPDPTELKIALDNRAFEIQLFWQRSNYFLVLMTALGIGTFSIKDPLFSPIISLFATICSYFWFRNNLGSKFWQESWETEVNQLSHELGVRSFQKTTEEVRRQVRDSLQIGNTTEGKPSFRRWIDTLTVRKYSVTYNMILLSFWSIIFWFSVTIILTVKGAGSGSFLTPAPPNSEALSKKALAKSVEKAMPSPPVRRNKIDSVTDSQKPINEIVKPIALPR